MLKVHHTGEEHKHLVGRIVVVGDQDREIGSSWSTFAGFVSKLASELIEGLIQFILRHQITTIVTKLKDKDRYYKDIIAYFCYLDAYCMLGDDETPADPNKHHNKLSSQHIHKLYGL